MTPPYRAVIALGANLGERAATLLAATRALAETEGIELVALSPFVESAAVKLAGVDLEAPRYLNGVILVDTSLTPRELLDVANTIEEGHGRTRLVRWGDRTLDLDIIDYAGQSLETRRLTLPHPRAAERDFVLVPWLSVDPDAELPGLGRVDALLAALEVTVVAQDGGSAASGASSGLGASGAPAPKRQGGAS